MTIACYDVEGNINPSTSLGLLGSKFYLPASLYLLPLQMICLNNAIIIFDNTMGKAKYDLLAYLCGIVLWQPLTDGFMDNFNPFSVDFIPLATLFFMSS